MKFTQAVAALVLAGAVTAASDSVVPSSSVSTASSTETTGTTTGTTVPTTTGSETTGTTTGTETTGTETTGTTTGTETTPTGSQTTGTTTGTETTSSASTTSSGSTVPTNNAFFYQGEIYFQFYVEPASEYTAVNFYSDVDPSVNGFQYDPSNIFGLYQSSARAGDFTSDSTALSLDVSGPIAFEAGEEYLGFYLNGPLAADAEEYVAAFLFEYQNGAAVKRDVSTSIIVTATSTDALPAGLPFTTTGPLYNPSSTTTSGSSESTTTTGSSETVSSSVTSSGSGITSATDSTTSGEVSTVITHSTTVITITSCEDDKCTEVPVTTGVTVITEEDTVYTTYCPETETKEGYSTVIVHSTTVVTITSCEDDKCTEVPVTTGVTVVTEEDTVYTTYCPETETTITYTKTGTKTAAPTTGAPTTVLPTTVAPTTGAPTSTSTVAPEQTETTESEFSAAAGSVYTSGALFSLMAALLSLMA